MFLYKKIMYPNGPNIGLLLRGSKRQVNGVETQSKKTIKKKFWTHSSVKMVILTIFMDMKGQLTINFLEKSATVNSISCCQILWKNLLY